MVVGDINSWQATPSNVWSTVVVFLPPPIFNMPPPPLQPFPPSNVKPPLLQDVVVSVVITVSIFAHMVVVVVRVHKFLSGEYTADIAIFPIMFPLESVCVNSPCPFCWTVAKSLSFAPEIVYLVE